MAYLLIRMTGLTSELGHFGENGNPGSTMTILPGIGIKFPLAPDMATSPADQTVARD